MSYPTRKNWEALAAAICKQGLLDYEILISDKPLHATISEKYVNMHDLKLFLQEQVLLDIDLWAMAKKIKRVYLEQFRPYCFEHEDEIVKSWKKVKPTQMNYEQLKTIHPFFCPLCGGIIRPGSKKYGAQGYLVCTHCNLNVRMNNYKPERRNKKCSTQA